MMTDDHNFHSPTAKVQIAISAHSLPIFVCCTYKLRLFTIAKHNSRGCLIVGVGVSNFITVSHFLYAQFSTDHLSNPNSR